MYKKLYSTERSGMCRVERKRKTRRGALSKLIMNTRPKKLSPSIPSLSNNRKLGKTAGEKSGRS